MLSRATYTTRAQCQLPRQAPSAAGSASVNHNLVPTQMTGNNTPISGPQLERLPAETLIGGGASHPPQQPEQQLSLRAVSAIEQLKYQFPVNPIRFRDIAWRFKQLPTHWQERALDYRMGKPDLNSLDHAARQADYEHWWTDGLTEEQRRWHGRVRHLVEDMTMAAETTQVEHATMLQHIAHLQVYITRETEPALFQALTDFRVLHDGIPLPLHHATSILCLPASNAPISSLNPIKDRVSQIYAEPWNDCKGSWPSSSARRGAAPTSLQWSRTCKPGCATVVLQVRDGISARQSTPADGGMVFRRML